MIDRFLEVRKLIELGPIIDSDGFDAAFLLVDALNDAPIELFGNSYLQPSDDGVERFSLDEGDDAVGISPPVTVSPFPAADV